jgi:serine O-acetyltransferase
MNKQIYDDLYRYVGKQTGYFYLFRLFFFTPSYRYVYLFRRTKTASTLITQLFWKFLLRRCMLNTGIQIPPSTKIGKGLRIVHFGHIIVNPFAEIGNNFNIFPGVTIGGAEGKKKGFPKIGNNVCLLTNSVVVGGISIGDNVVIAPNSFVNFDVPNDSIVIGNPAKILQSDNPSKKYIVYKVE